ncbi:hypothetical protein DRQ32_07135, partial [bacterium]
MARLTCAARSPAPIRELPLLVRSRASSHEGTHLQSVLRSATGAPRRFGFRRIKTELLSGLTVAMALVPEAIAFAFVAGLAPSSGLYAAFIVGLITAMFGGRPGMISGATGALAVVMVSLVANHGPEYLFATVVMMGLLQLLAGFFHLGKFIRL